MGQRHLVPLRGPPNFSFRAIPAMTAAVPFYSIHDEAKWADLRVYHNNTDCPIAKPYQAIGGAQALGDIACA